MTPWYDRIVNDKNQEVAPTGSEQKAECYQNTELQSCKIPLVNVKAQNVIKKIKR